MLRAQLGLVIALVPGAVCFGSTPRYSWLDIGKLPGDTTAEAVAVNDFGQVVGKSILSKSGTTINHGFVWTKEHGMRALAVPVGGTNAWPVAINNSGEIVGIDQTRKGPYICLWTDSDQVRVLSKRLGVPTGINDSGTVCGYVLGRGFMPIAAEWTPKGGLTELAVPWSNQGTSANAINDRGNILGDFTFWNQEWSSGVSWVQADTPCKVLFPNTGVFLEGINDAGTLTGYLYTSSIFGRGFVQTREGEYTVIGPKANEWFGDIPVAIDEASEIVGNSAQTGDTAWFWSVENGLSDLHSLVQGDDRQRIFAALGMSKGGAIAGSVSNGFRTWTHAAVFFRLTSSDTVRP